MREIALDTETTGLDPLADHRVVEIGAVELVDHLPTGRTFHCYLNPERNMPADAVAVHGLTAAFLADKPPFEYVADELLAFLGDAPLVAHDAGFDIAFLNAELKRAAKPTIRSQSVRAFPRAMSERGGSSCRRRAIACETTRPTMASCATPLIPVLVRPV